VNIFEHIKGAHRENFVSDFYQTFLTEKVSKEVNKVVLEAFLKAYYSTKGEKSFSFDLTQPFDAQREVSTKKGGRIDIVIRGKSGETNKAIIVESKMRGDLKNDLKDYYNSIDLPETDKIALILSIAPLEDPDKVFVNITHKQVAENVLSKIPSLSKEHREVIYLEDFAEHLVQLGKQTEWLQKRYAEPQNENKNENKKLPTPEWLLKLSKKLVTLLTEKPNAIWNKNSSGRFVLVRHKQNDKLFLFIGIASFVKGEYAIGLATKDNAYFNKLSILKEDFSSYGNKIKGWANDFYCITYKTYPVDLVTEKKLNAPIEDIAFDQISPQLTSPDSEWIALTHKIITHLTPQ